jgi:hypothetical protein
LKKFTAVASTGAGLLANCRHQLRLFPIDSSCCEPPPLRT